MHSTNASTLLLLITMGLGSTGCAELAAAIRGPKSEAKEKQAAEKEATKVAEFRAAINSASCDDLFRVYRERRTPENYDSSTARDTRVLLARKFVECKKHAELFSCLGNQIGQKYFRAAKEEGVDVVGALKGYLASPDRQGMFTLDSCKDEEGYSLRAVYKWLDGEEEDLCSDFIAAMEKDGPETRAGIVAGYLTPKKCAGAAKLAVAGLQADATWAKEATCIYLGTYGDASYVQDIETVANAHSEVVYDRGRAFVPVRDVCLQAAAKLKLTKSQPASETPAATREAPKH